MQSCASSRCSRAPATLLRHRPAAAAAAAAASPPQPRHSGCGAHPRAARQPCLPRSSGRRCSTRLAAGASEAAPAGATPPAQQPPRPPEVPGLRHAPLMLWHLAQGRNVEDILLLWEAQHGPFVEWQLPGTPAVVSVSDPQALREAWEAQNWPKSPLYNDLLPLLGPQSLVLTAGEPWRRQREAFNPGFSAAFLRAALPGFLECSARLAACLETAAEEVEVVRMHDLAVQTTLEVICQVGFGERTDLLGGAGTSHPLWTSFEGLGRHVAFYLDNVPLNGLKHLPWNRAKAERLQSQLDGQLLAILNRRLVAMGMRTGGSSASSSASSSAGGCPLHSAKAGSADGVAAAGGAAPGGEGAEAGQRDILSLAVELSAQEGVVDEEALLSQMKIAWAIYFLTTRPDAEAQLVAELRTHLGDPDTSGSSAAGGGASGPSWQQLQECEFLGAVLRETLRVRPPVSLMARIAPPGATLGGYDVGGKVVLASPFVLHRHASWGADPEAWRPERWLQPGGAAEVAAADPWRYLPFSRGPRNCIGERFAMLEARAILATLYQRFEFEYAGPEPERVLMTVTAHPRHGVPVRVRRRAAAARAGAAP